MFSRRRMYILGQLQLPINQHLHVGVVERRNVRVYRDRLSVENGVARMPETTIFPER
jgi:hypothetical protein